MAFARELIAGGNRVAHGLAAALGGQRLQILIFHRVLAQPDPLFPGEMDAPRFDRLAGLLARSFRVMTLAAAARHLAAATLPPRALVITFDDGYADNAELALPILKRHGLVGSFFVSTGFLDGGRMWNDTVIEAFRRSTIESIDLGFVGLGRLPLTTLDKRRAAIRQVLPKVKYMGLAEREQTLGSLRAALRPTALPDDLMMRSAQVRTLAEAGMEIGAHTVNHPILSAIPLPEAEAEIARGRSRLAELTGAPIEVLAYPNGVPGRDYGAEHVALVRRLGFVAAVSTAAGAARPGADLFQLPRFTPWDRSLPRWSARLWLNGRQGAAALA
jgi:peptidoglycan/xylan/chitin deacetylase (PgdA/CDA1 family)